MMIEAENGIIGCVLFNNECIEDVSKKLKPEMFADEIAADCYREMLDLYDRHGVIDIVPLSQALESAKYDSGTVMEYLKTCVNSNVTSVLAPGYADAIEKEWKSRTVKQIFEKMSLLPKDIDQSITDALILLEELIRVDDTKARTLADIIQENTGNYFVENKNEDAVKLGFYQIDDTIGCLELGDVTVIGARPAVGKSALATQIMVNMAKSGKNVCLFNLEMKDTQIYERIFANASANIDLTRLRRAKSFLNGEEQEFTETNDKISKLPITIATGINKVSEMKSIAKQTKCDVVIVDYLQLIRSEKFYANRASEVGEISKSVKQMAMQLNIPVILLSQLNRKSELDETREPQMSELRESGDIEQDASNILLIWNVSTATTSYKAIKIAKNRQGELTKVGMEYTGRHMMFREFNGNFDKFMSTVKNYENSAKTLPDEETPFD